jgi:flagella basal body P-ring formation protein FlgA
MLKCFLVSLLLMPTALLAETVVATRTIRSHAIIGPNDVTIKPVESSGSLSEIRDAVGKEARVILYAGRPIRPGDVGPVALIERNQIVPLVFISGNIKISTEARSLGRGGEGDFIRVMNLSSRTTITGEISADGSVTVKQ